MQDFFGGKLGFEKSRFSKSQYCVRKVCISVCEKIGWDSLGPGQMNLDLLKLGGTENCIQKTNKKPCTQKEALASSNHYSEIAPHLRCLFGSRLKSKTKLSVMIYVQKTLGKWGKNTIFYMIKVPKET